MTNSPVYDQQIAINTYWDLIGGNRMLPGTINAADRYVRASYAPKGTLVARESNVIFARTHGCVDSNAHRHHRR